MRLRKRLIVLLCIFILSINIVAADGNAFDLNSAIDKAINISSTIKSLDNDYDDMTEDIDDVSKSLLRAQDMLNIDARFVYLERKKDKTLEEQLEYQNYKMAFGEPMSEEEKLPFLITWNTSLGNFSNYIDINRNTRATVANQIRVSIYEQYNNLMKLKDSLDIQSKLVQNLEKSNQQAQLNLKFGKISKVDARLVEISYIKSKLELSKMQRNFDMTLINLNKTIGEPVDKKYISYSSDNMSIMTAIKPYDEYLSDAMKNRAEILNAELGYKLKKIEYDLTKAAYPLESDIHNSDAKFAMDDAYNTLEAAKIDLEIEIASAYKELEKRLKNWESSEKLYQSAQENYKGVVSKYSMNMVTEKVLTDANISLAKAEMQLKNARRDLWIQQLKMEYASGIGPGIKNFAY